MVRHLYRLNSHEIYLPQSYHSQINLIDNLKEVVAPSAILVDWRFANSYSLDLNLVEKPSLKQAAYLFDALMLSDRWETHLLLDEGFAALFSYYDLNYLPMNWVYLTDYSPVAQLFIHLLFARGYRRFRIIISEERSEQITKDLEALFLGAQFELISFNKMVLLKPEGGVLVCTQEVEKMGEEVLSALSYFNFLKKKSIIFDILPEQNQWIRTEARATSMEVIDYHNCSSISSWVFIKKFINPSLSFKDFLNET